MPISESDKLEVLTVEVSNPATVIDEWVTVRLFLILLMDTVTGMMNWGGAVVSNHDGFSINVICKL